MQFRYHSIYMCLGVVVLFSVVGLQGCGKKDKDKDEDGGSLTLTGAAALVGVWSGVYNALDSEGKPDGDAVPARISFTENGTFALELTDDATAKAEGTWQEFEGKSLFLTVSKSAISRLPPSNRIREASYDLMGTSLRVKTSAFEVRATKQNNPATSQTNGEAASLTGRWSCELNGVKTQLNIAENNSWQAVMQQNNEAVTSLSGYTQLVNGGHMQLQITSSSHSVKPGSYLILTTTVGGATLATHVDGTDQTIGVCRR